MRRFLLPAAATVTMLAAIWMAFVVVPAEREMGDVQRIMYFHVASAWAAFASFFVVAGASVQYLRKGAPGADRLAAPAQFKAFEEHAPRLIHGARIAAPVLVLLFKNVQVQAGGEGGAHGRFRPAPAPAPGHV